MEGRDCRSAINALGAEFSRLALLKDFSGIANLYAPNAKLYTTEQDEPLTGRQEITQLLSALCGGYGVHSYDLKEVEFFGGEENAVQTGTFTCQNEDGIVVFGGKYVTVFKKIGNRWFITHDFSNSDKHDVRGELRERFARWNQLFHAGDIPTLVEEMYTNDAKILLPGYPMVQGKADVIKLLKEYPHAEIIRTDQVQGEIEQVSADVVVECGGTFTVRDRTGVPADKGQYIVVWKRVNGKFCIDSDIMRPLAH